MEQGAREALPEEVAMATLHEIGDRTFSWRPINGATTTIKVYAGATVFGTLRLEGDRRAVAEMGGSRWVFEAGKGSVTVRGEQGAVLATFAAGTGGDGTLTLADGRMLRWAPTHPGRDARAFYDGGGTRVVRFWKDHQLLKTEDRGAADLGMAARPEFPLLVALGRVIGIGQGEDGTTESLLATVTALSI